MRRVVVVGGGVAGLALALAVPARAGAAGVALELRVLEAAPRAGGNLRSERTDGYTVEWGPNGFLDNVPATLDLVRRTGLEAELQPADAAAARRFLYRRGRLHELAPQPLKYLASPVLSVRGRRSREARQETLARESVALIPRHGGVSFVRPAWAHSWR